MTTDPSPRPAALVEAMALYLCRYITHMDETHAEEVIAPGLLTAIERAGYLVVANLTSAEDRALVAMETGRLPVSDAVLVPRAELEEALMWTPPDSELSRSLRQRSRG